MSYLGRTSIYVYAHWLGMPEPAEIGVLAAHQAKGKKAFSFEYNKAWLGSRAQLLLDPDISWYTGLQFPEGKENFGVFLDSMPDTWGRVLLKRRAAQLANQVNEPAPKLYDIDFLLGVYDESRMGALRYKLDPEGPFLDDNKGLSVPPWSSIRELQHAVTEYEKGNLANQWLQMLIKPGTSLGGARPKANVLDENGSLWIAKFPSINDGIDKGAWEFLAYQLAIKAGINMAPSELLNVAGHHHTFLTKRFDRQQQERIHFASAMTMTGNNENIIKESPASYLDIAEFIQYNGSNSFEDLIQLWRRMVFNIAISNTDDHLRNHGFVVIDDGWRLSPAFDINPSIDKDGLSLNIDSNNNSLDYNLAKSVGSYFQLGASDMDTILAEVKGAVSRWKDVAETIGIHRAEQQLMQSAFRV